MMRFLRHLLLTVAVSASGTIVCHAQTSADVIVYGSTPGGFCAAIGAAREGASVILLEPTSHVGGMNTGGLCFSDSDQMYREQLMGLFHEWHLRIQQDYESRGVSLPYNVNVKNQATWSYEAHVAQRVTDAMLAEAGVTVLTERHLQSVTSRGPRITGIVTGNGTFTGRVFIDGSYEGDLMAAAGVNWRIDRESRAEYGESYAGRQYPKSLMDINGFDDEGKPLPLITVIGKGPDEIGDDELMVYSYRIPMTKNAANKVAMPAPKNYDPARFEVVRRFVKRHGESKVKFSYLPVPNHKIDANNEIGSQFSIGLVGGAKDWAEADQAGRAAILEAHKQYTLEFIHFMKTDPVFSQKRRDDIAGWGLCADEFAANGHFPPQLYVRASRRMKGVYVMTQADILTNITKPDPIMVASFPIDSHDCRRVAIKGGGVINEGTIFPVRQMPERIGYPHHVPYRAILPQPAECDNLLVPVALSCTHVAMSSLRIEATWMLIGQSAGIAAALTADRDVAVQDLPYSILKPCLEAQGQALTLPKGFQPPKGPVSGETSQSLDGVWRFTIDVSNPPASWVDMTVPGNWDSTPKFSTYVGVGWYRRTFTPDPALQGKSVRLHFGAVYHEAEVFLNGASIGTHVGGYTPFEFDVTDKLIFGQPNEITVSADNTYKRGAWWPWGGISRSVQLIGNNPVRLVWQHIHGDPDLAAGTATVAVKYRLQNTGGNPADVVINSRLATWDKELVNATHTVNAGETKDVTARFNLPAEQVRLWHFDHPEFYHLQTTLTVSGQVQHAVSDRFGIRQLVGATNADFDPAFIPRWESFARGQFPNLLGASLWSFNDYRSNVRNTPPTGFRSWGVVDQNRNLKPAYHTIRKLHSPVEIHKVDGVTATVKTRPPGHIPSYTLKGYKLVWVKGKLTGEVPLPTLKPGDPAWTGDLPVSGATLKLVTPLGYDIDDTMGRSSSSDGMGIVLDDPVAEFAGAWNTSTTIPGYIGSGYRLSGAPGQANDGSATATFRFTAPAGGLSAVAARPLLSRPDSVLAAESSVPIGIAEIDAMRREFAGNPTTPENAPRRRALIFSRVRRLVHRGVDMAGFHDACAGFSQWGRMDPTRYKANDKRYGPIVRGRQSGGLKGYLTDVLADEAAMIPSPGIKAHGGRRNFLRGLTACGLIMATARTNADPALFDGFTSRPRIDYLSLSKGFSAPPMEARLRVWWFWHSGLATKESITRDLEAMKANGIGGALICDNGTKQGPVGPVFMSQGWQDLFAHAIREATRLGIEISLNIQSGAGDPGNPKIANDNGLKELVTAQTTVSGPGRVEMRLPMPPANPIFYQDVAVQAVRKASGRTGEDAIKNWNAKTFGKNDPNLDSHYDEFPGDGADQAVNPQQTPDLTENFKEGVLRWDAPPGEWTIIRYGMTSTGKRNHYASAGFRGGLCYDPIHKAGVTAQWNDVAKPLIDVAKQNGNSLKFLHLDSWEMGLCNWTHDFEKSFQQRRGYGMRTYLPVLAGHIVTNREVSDRFLEDFRQTVCDLAAEDQYEELRRLAHSEGLGLHMESAGPHQPPVDGLRTLGINDIPMGEAWARSTTHRVSEPERMHVALGASAAHIYGKRFLAAEAPTSVGPFWQRGPDELKNVLDRIFCSGVNRVNWHTYDSSPDELGLPGIAYFAGTHLNRHVTWWEESKAFIDYINRSQSMLIQGLQVADVLGYLGSRAPQFATLHRLERDDIPAGYAWDMCNSHAFLTRASVRDGRIVLPDGKNYALFALSHDKQMDLPVLRKIERLVNEGMVLVGNPPRRPFGLTGYPGSDGEFKELIAKLWGDANGTAPIMKPYGKGRVFVGQPVDQVLKALDLGPDLAWQPKDGIDLEYIHKQSADGEVDVYYVINKWARHGIDDLNYRYIPSLPDRFVNVTCSFRVAGERVVERWDPVRGGITPVQVVESKDGCHQLPVALEPEGGAFYVFRKARPGNRIARITKDGKRIDEGNTPLEVGASTVFVRDGTLETREKGDYEVTFADGRAVRIEQPAKLASVSIRGPWKVDFLERPQLGAPFCASYDTLKSWTESADHNERYFSGTACYTRSFSINPAALAADRRAYLDLGFVGDIATVRINAREVGILWKPPYIADVTGFLKPGDNVLEVEVTNQWVNRLVGDLKLPPAERKTYTSVLDGPPPARKDPRSPHRLGEPDADKYLRVSGLIGPVEIWYSQTHRLAP